MPETLELLIRKRAGLRSSCTKLLKKLEAELEKPEKDFNAIEEGLNQLMTKELCIVKADEEVIAAISNVNDIDREVQSAQDQLDQITLWKTRASRALRSQEDTGNGHSQTRETKTLRLPKLTIEQFNGDVSCWQSFWSQYDLAIHQNSTLNKVDKFNYLKAYITGQAANAVAGLTLSDENYDSAIDILTKRFGRKDLVINAHMTKLLNLNPVQKSSDIRGLRELYDICELQIRSLNSLGVTSKTYGSLLCPVLLRVLPDDISLEYSRKRESDEEWEVAEILTFLRREVEGRERALLLKANRSHKQSDEPSSSQAQNKAKSGSGNKKLNQSMPSASALQASAQAPQCTFCNNNGHSNENCEVFSKQQKKEILQKQRRCFICLKPNHLARFCKKKVERCVDCQRKHHVSICMGGETASETAEGGTVVTSVARGNESLPVMLQTLRVVAVGNNSKQKSIRCLLDGGSQKTFVTESTSKELELEVMGEETLSIYAFGDLTPKLTTRKKVKLILKNIQQPTKCIELEALEIPNISGASICVPNETVHADLVKRKIELSDIQVNNRKPEEISVLIGSDHYWRIITGKVERLGDSLVALDSLLGWTVQGTTTAFGLTLSSSFVSVNKLVTEEVENTSVELRKFWELESLGIKDDSQVQTEDLALKKFESTVSFVDNRYQVTLPWKPNHPKLPDNYELAKSRLEGMFKRFKRDPNFYHDYEAVINEQILEGVIEEVPEGSGNPKQGSIVHYIPHHAVINNEKSTKLRIVYDASAHQRGHPSLNQCLLVGPNLNPDLLVILLKFRLHRIGITADIRKAFLQISLAEESRDAVRFLWFKEYPISFEEKNIKTLRMSRVLFGAAPSPFLLSATVRHHLNLCKNTYPKTCELLEECLYMDDFVTGTESEGEAQIVMNEATLVMSKAGMDLTKWKRSPSCAHEEVNENSFGETLPGLATSKVLGLTWDTQTDVIGLDVRSAIEFSVSGKPSKRNILQIASRIFDPVGYISPFVVRIKCILQELWTYGLDWDEEIPEQLLKKWQVWHSELPLIREVSIPRWYFRTEGRDSHEDLEIHAFCDASERAFGTVVYLRYSSPSGVVNTSLVCSKSRVSPIKRVTLPRLELMGAIIGTRLVKFIRNKVLPVDRVFLWTDSQITLHWIKGNATRWKPFVQNRVLEIQGNTDPDMWFYCPSKENPADFVSRGLQAKDLAENQLWWNGPYWLRNPRENWPSHGFSVKPSEELLKSELRAKEVFLSHCAAETKPTAIFNLEDKSSLLRVHRITSWVKRFLNNSSRKEKQTGPLSLDEIFESQIFWIAVAQNEIFGKEILALNSGKEIDSQSKIRNLNPKLDENKLLCVGGRIEESKLGEREKHPWILPYNHCYSELVVISCHERVMHSGLSDTLVQVRETYFIISGRRLVKKVLHACLICKRFSVKPGKQAVAPLPQDRISEAPPFSVTGLDFAGPIYYKDTSSTKKAYILLCTCAVTRAVHLEVVPELTTFTFLLAFRRFVARRGICKTIYSDNAQTFKRANKDLQLLWRNLDRTKMQDAFGTLGIKWKFIIERGPWWGGFYERLVRSMKASLKKTLGKTSLTLQELTTTVTEVEAIMNSRPLTYVYTDGTEPSPLTPAHFLVGQRLTTIPSGAVKEDVNPSTVSKRGEMTRRLKYRDTMLNHYWNRWRKEYLVELRTSPSHLRQQGTDEFKVGDIVLIEEDKIPRQLWKLGRVEEVFLGRDKKIRACSVRTSGSSVLRRPVQRLYNLELQ